MRFNKHCLILFTFLFSSNSFAKIDYTQCTEILNNNTSGPITDAYVPFELDSNGKVKAKASVKSYEYNEEGNKEILIYTIPNTSGLFLFSTNEPDEEEVTVTIQRNQPGEIEFIHYSYGGQTDSSGLKAPGNILERKLTVKSKNGKCFPKKLTVTTDQESEKIIFNTLLCQEINSRLRKEEEITRDLFIQYDFEDLLEDESVGDLTKKINEDCKERGLEIFYELISKSSTNERHIRPSSSNGPSVAR